MTEDTHALVMPSPSRNKWAAVVWHDGDTTPYLRAFLWTTEDEQGRAVITRIVLDSDRLTLDRLREIPLSRLETLVNANAGGVSWTDTFDPTRAQLDGDFAGLLSHLPDGWNVPDGSDREPLRRPYAPGAPRGDDFYRSVATAYLDVVRKTRAVAPVLAEEAGVPVGTAHRWILGARRRGFLPEAGRKPRD